MNTLRRITRSSYRADVGVGVVAGRETERVLDPVIMGLSCMDDYNGALNPITLRDGEREGGCAFRTSESSCTHRTCAKTLDTPHFFIS